jgi:hypothetical protein
MEQEVEEKGSGKRVKKTGLVAEPTNIEWVVRRGESRGGDKGSKVKESKEKESGQGVGSWERAVKVVDKKE